MYKAGVFVVLFICFLSICSALTLEDFVDIQQYESAQSGFWPMPGANIENNGYSDMAALEFDSSTPRQLLKNDEGITRSPPVMDRNGFVYTVQKTNHTKNLFICTVECYDPSKNDEHLWSRDLTGYPMDSPCDQALISFLSANSFITIVDSYVWIFTLKENNTVPDPVLYVHRTEYNSSLLIPLIDHYFLIDDLVTRDLHIIQYFTESNCSNSTNSNCTTETIFIDRPTNLKSDPLHSPAAHWLQYPSTVSGLQEAPAVYLFSGDEDTLVAFNAETNQPRWNVTLTYPQKFMSNIAIATGPNPVIFVLVITNTLDSQIMLHGYNMNGAQIYSQHLFNPAGAERTPGRLSVDVHHDVVVAMIESAPANDTLVFAYAFLNNSMMNRSLEEANFQGPVSIDWQGRYYIVTSQYSGYLVMSSDDLSTVDRVLDVQGGMIVGVHRNYAALGNGTLVVTGSGGVVGFAPPEEHHSSGGNNHRTVIILLCVFGGLVVIVLLLAVAGLLYHYYNRNKKQGYEQI